MDVRTPYTAPFSRERKKGLFTKVFGTAFKNPMKAVEMSSTDDAFGSGVLFWVIFIISAGVFSGVGASKLITVIYDLMQQISGMSVFKSTCYQRTYSSGVRTSEKKS